eukprot:g13524.t1
MVYLRSMKNGGKGHCCFETVAQAFAIGEGWDVDLVERAFTAGDSKQLFRLHSALRRLTIEVFDAPRNDMIIGGMTAEQTAHDEAGIRRLALDYNQCITSADDFRNVVLYMDPELGGGGHGGMRALLALSEGLGVDLHMGQQVDVLAQYGNGSTRKCMALQNGDGHWSLVVLNEGKRDEEATKVGSESDVLDFIEQRVNLSLAGLATRTGDDATSTGDGFKPCDIEVGVGSDTDSTSGGTSDPIQEYIISTWSDPISETRSPTSSRASWTSHPWEDDEHWGDYQKYLGHNSSFAEEEEEEEEEDEICLGESLWREWTRGPEELARLARVVGRRRRMPASFRGGGDPREEDEQGTGEETGQGPVVTGAQADAAPPTGGGKPKRANAGKPRSFYPTSAFAEGAWQKETGARAAARDAALARGDGLAYSVDRSSGAKRKAVGGGGGGSGGKHPRCPAGGGCLGGGGGGGGRDLSGGDDDDGAASMEVSDDDMSRAAFGGGRGDDSGSEWSAGANDGDDGGGDTDGEGDISSRGSSSGSDNSGSDGSGGRGRGGGGRAPKRLNGTARVSGPDLMGIFTTPSSNPSGGVDDVRTRLSLGLPHKPSERRGRRAAAARESLWTL